MAQLTLEQAKSILKKHTTEEHLFTHAAAVSAAMGAMAEHFGEDKGYWEAVGYLHDVDYEKFPDEHCKHVRELLAPEGVDDETIETIISHGWGLCVDEPEPKTPIQKSLVIHNLFSEIRCGEILHLGSFILLSFPYSRLRRNSRCFPVLRTRNKKW